MHRWARLTYILLTTAALTAPTLAQLATPQPASQAAPSAPTDAKSKAEQEKETAARHQAALSLLDLVLAGSKNLSLPQNRIAIASDAFPILWTRNQPQARSLVTQMAGDFAQAASREQETPEPNSRQLLHQQWQTVLQTIAQSDAELALSFMNATHTFAQIEILTRTKPKSATCVWNSPPRKPRTILATPCASPRRTCKLPANCPRNSSIC
jgi:hypothetical protein